MIETCDACGGVLDDAVVTAKADAEAEDLKALKRSIRLYWSTEAIAERMARNLQRLGVKAE